MYHVVSISQKGSKSSVNEDACIALSNKGIFVVADGVGGGPSGDFASRTLVEEVEHICSSGDDPENDLPITRFIASSLAQNLLNFSEEYDKYVKNLCGT